MTYVGFLLLFLVVPILALAGLSYRDRRQGRALPAALGLIRPWQGIVALGIVAVVYTTPWDNYLVATNVWWYDPAKVLGITLGWVPLEEYLFFVLQTVLTGLWLIFLARRMHISRMTSRSPRLRVGATAVVALAWAASVVLLLSGSKPGNYLALELAWALPPIALQLAVGADVLWHQRRLVALAIITPTLFLCGADALAIDSGTWTINPERSLGVLVGGVLPLEEVLFFLLTNTLLVFGLVLALARDTVPALERLKARLPVRLHQSVQGQSFRVRD